MLTVSFLLAVTVSALSKVKVLIGPVYPEPYKQTFPQIVAYNDGVMNGLMGIDFSSKYSCVPPALQVFKALAYDKYQDQDQLFWLPVIIKNNGHTTKQISALSVSNYYSHSTIYSYLEYPQQKIPPQQIIPEERYVFNIVHRCEQKIKNSNYWSIINLSVQFTNEETLSFQYQFLCDVNFHPMRFDFGSLLLVFMINICILVLARFGKISAFKIMLRFKAPISNEHGPASLDDDHIFQGFFLNYKFAIGYIAILLIGLVLSLWMKQSAEEQEENVVHFFCFFLSFYFFDECLTLLESPWLKKKLLCLRRQDILSIFLALVIEYLYLYYNKPWFLSDVISLCLLGALGKLFKLKSLKEAVSFFLPVLIMDILISIYLAITVRYEWDSVAMKYFDTPFSPQMPLFHYTYKKKCSWISFFNICFPAFFVGYSYRFDYCKKLYVYQIVSFLGLLCGMLFWISCQFLITYSLPMQTSYLLFNSGLFTVGPMIAFTSGIAYKRHEISQFWTGLFYDELLLSPFGQQPQEDLIEINLFKKQQIEEYNNPIDLDNQNQRQIVIPKNDGNLALNSNIFSGLSPAPNQMEQAQIKKQQGFSYKR